ncbi:hypothetical protein I6M49_22070 [Shewanella algae]|uniref:hypothetical protein n=1 Tax=Shewanella algae TaxID=38313 RepID=UPI001AAC7E60|nr:hypothetical protein [Shewanella algae]MBO2656132.1 hypothetical protein [Shewanella algae]
MLSYFKDNLKVIASLFDIQAQTLKLWASAENRSAHRDLLSLATMAINYDPSLQALLDGDAGLQDIASSLGIDNPLNSEISGVSGPTFRSWFTKPEKRKLVIGFLLGLYQRSLSEASEGAGFNSVEALLKRLRKLDIEPGRIVRLLRIDEGTAIILLGRCK